MGKEKEQSGGGSLLDALPDDVIPEDYKIAQREGTSAEEPELAIDIPKETLEELRRGTKAHRRTVKSIMGRKLDKEKSVLYRFLEMGKDRAAVRTYNKSEAVALRNRLYFARKQEEYRVGLIEDPSVYEVERQRVEPLEHLAFSIDEDERGDYVLIYIRSPMVLEDAPD